MRITPLDIRRREFKRALRGYSDEEVDTFLDEVADELELITQENAELKERLERAEEQIATYAQLRDALEKTLVQAQLQAEEIRANARKESELIMRDAQVKARSIINDAYVETRKVQQTLAQLSQLEEEFRFKFRSLLEGYLKLLDELSLAPAEIPTAPSPRTEMAGGVPESPQTTHAGPAVGQGMYEEVAAGGGQRAHASVSEGAGVISEDDTPTQETPSEEPAGVVASASTSSTTSEVLATPDTALDGSFPEEDTDEEVQTFFFGKVTEEQASSFFEGEPGGGEKRRDFEW